MSADLLRRAAAKIRETAGAADALGQVADKITTSECPELAEHIAIWHPGVAFAVADVLSELAGEVALWESHVVAGAFKNECRLARLILNEEV